MESKMMVPEMTKKGFSLEFSSVVTAASSMITPLIPPGIVMILYGCIANVSIGKLFISGRGVRRSILRFHDDPCRRCLQETWIWYLFNNREINLVQVLDRFKTQQFCRYSSRSSSSAVSVSVSSQLPRPEQLQFFTLHFWELSTMRCTSRI